MTFISSSQSGCEFKANDFFANSASSSARCSKYIYIVLLKSFEKNLMIAILGECGLSQERIRVESEQTWGMDRSQE